MDLANIAGVDIAIIAIITISALMSIKRGFIREALSLVIWVAAVAAAIIFHPQITPLLEDYITVPSLQKVAAMAILFVITLMLGSVVSFALSSLIQATGLTSTDRFLGVLFGALRGVLIVSLLVMFTKGLFSEDTWWTASNLIPHFEAIESCLTDAGSLLYDFFQEQVFGNTAEA